MKTGQLLLLFFFLAISLQSCQQSSQMSEQKDQKTETTSDQTYLKSQVNNLLNQYYVLKDALVATDATKGQEAATELLQVINAGDISKADEADATTYSTHTDSMKSAVEAIANESDVEAQRVSFEQVTANMLALVKAFDPSDETIYYQFCPMAFDFKGAYWLSNEKQVMNPYFGDKMLHCGKVAEEL